MNQCQKGDWNTSTLLLNCWKVFSSAFGSGEYCTCSEGCPQIAKLDPKSQGRAVVEARNAASPPVLALDSHIRESVEKRDEKGKNIVFTRSVFSFASYFRSHQTKGQERKLQILFKRQRKEKNSNNNKKKESQKVILK